LGPAVTSISKSEQKTHHNKKDCHAGASADSNRFPWLGMKIQTIWSLHAADVIGSMGWLFFIGSVIPWVRHG
jgi:hypothetical protein